MTQATWEKPQAKAGGQVAANAPTQTGGRWKFMLGGLLIIASIGFLVLTSTSATAQSFTTIEQILDDPAAFTDRTVRISGAVIGDTIRYDRENLDIAFTIAHIPAQFDNLAEALFIAANDSSSASVPVFVSNTVMPDLLRHEAQAILTGTLGEDGVFYATELLLKCPSRFEDGGSRNNLAEDHPGAQLFSGTN
ncbi:MAG: cytochrome c maturation protein CcmE [Anaerolineaceae bacterium]|nr:MAG: cytochrome c maturation protein CcmE [Anaerolineaceae bacterium]